MNDDKSDIVSMLEQGSSEPADTSADAGFVATGASGETITLGETPDYTQVIRSDDIQKR